MSYLLAHWRGQLTLSKSLWINFLALMLLISAAELWLLARFASSATALMGITLGSLLLTRLVIFPWQLLGLIRSAEQDYIRHGNLLRLRAVQMLGVSSILFTLVYSLEVAQGAAYYKQQLSIYSGTLEAPEYTLSVDTQKQQLSINGGLGYGITAAVAAQLKANPGLTSVSLSSPGGQIYEGRGLARLFMREALDTYVYTVCSSACTTAFVGGRRRYLGPQGKLGFHQYRLDRTQYKKAVVFFDPLEQQQRDLQLFKERGIKAEFLDQMFQQPAEGIWYPASKQLLDARLVHQVLQR